MHGPLTARPQPCSCPTRRSARILKDDEESTLGEVLSRISGITNRRGILVKPFFDDFARNKNSSCLVGHVTEKQFRQTLDVHLQLGLTTPEVDLVVHKFFNEDYPEMVNYIAFSAT